MLCGCVLSYAPGALPSLNRICRVPFHRPDADPWTDKAGIVLYFCHCQQILAKYLTFCFEFFFPKREDLLLFWLKLLHYYWFGAELLHWYLCVIYCSNLRCVALVEIQVMERKSRPFLFCPLDLYFGKKKKKAKLTLQLMARDGKYLDFSLIVPSFMQYDVNLKGLQVNVCGKTVLLKVAEEASAPSHWKCLCSFSRTRHKVIFTSFNTFPPHSCKMR